MTPIITAEEEAEVMPCLSSCESSRWYPAFADVTAKGVDKGEGVKSVAKYCGFSISEVMAFGDGGNDTNMLKVAGIGVAMGNAGDSLKKVADYVTTTVDDDGIRRALEHFHVI